MKKEIVINASKDRSRIAIVENGELVELYIENPDNVRTIGNVYLGRIQKVMPAIRAAFVDVGEKQDCFLHFSDLTDNLPQLLALAGEEVPGLDAPVLSLAPSKRVADDEDEPDVEDALEVETPEEESSSSTRRSRGRRSRGRGRSRGRRGKGREEEEEQEEGRRTLPGVIDLSSPPKRRPTPTRQPEPEAEPAIDAPEAKTQEPEAPADETPKEEAPRGRRRTRKADSDEPKADEADEKKASRPKRSKKTDGEEQAADEPKDGPSAEATPDDSADGKSADEKDEAPRPKRSRRRRRGRRGRGESPRDQAEDQDDDSSDGSDDQADDSTQGDAPSKGRNRRSRGRSSKKDEPSEDEPTAEDEPSEDEAADDASGRKPLPPTLDLTGGSGRSSRSRRSTKASDDEDKKDDKKREPRAAEAAGDDSSDDSGRRSRRRTRGGQSDAEETKDEPPKSRSSRGRSKTSSDDDSKDQKGSSRGRSKKTSDDGASDQGSDGSGRGGRRRTRDDRSGSDGSSKDESSKGGSRGGSPRGDRRGRSDSKSSSRSGSIPPNEELLRRNGRVIVKITKEAISTKGPRVSTDLSLAGRFLVLVPAADYVAVSKKIESAKERRRLRTLASSLKPDGCGVIVRTVAEGRDAKSLDTDLRLLIEKWQKIESKLREEPEPPVLLYQDVNMVSSVIRDLFSEDYDRILVDDPKVFKNVQAYVKAVAPQMADKVELHQGRAPVYRSLGIERQVEEAFSKRVNMKGGGYLYIETTEAMHVVDVNSGRAGRGKSQKQNLIDVNVEAAREVAKQLRLRDLGGIIVVDFIDLRYDRDRKKVTDALKEAFERDRAVTKLLPMSDFGLVQITRQRLRPSITTQATDEDGEPLDAADAVAAAGAGEIRRQGQAAYEPEPEPAEDRAPERSRRDEPDRPSLAPEDSTPQALSGRLRGWLDHYRRTVDERYKGRPVAVRVHPLLGAYLRRGFPSPLTRWRLALRGITFVLEEDATVDPLAFDVRDQKSGRSLLKKYSAA